MAVAAGDSFVAMPSQYNLAPHMAAGYGYRSSTPAYDTPHGGSYMGTYGSSAAGGYANVNAYDSYVPPSPQQNAQFLPVPVQVPVHVPFHIPVPVPGPPEPFEVKVPYKEIEYVEVPTVVEKTTIVEVPNDPKPTKTRSIKVKAKPGILSLFCSEPGHACDCDEEEHEYEFDEEEELAAAAHKAKHRANEAKLAIEAEEAAKKAHKAAEIARKAHTEAAAAAEQMTTTQRTLRDKTHEADKRDAEAKQARMAAARAQQAIEDASYGEY